MPGPGSCTICRHERRIELELGLVARMPVPALAKRYDVSIHSLRRHAANHLGATQRAALALNLAPSSVDLEALSRSESESLLGNLLAQRARLSAYASASAESGDYKAAIAAERATTDALALTAKLLGSIVNRTEVTSRSILLTPDYLKLRAILVDVLKPYPEIAAKVAAALHQLESDAAKDITAKSNGTGVPPLIEGTST
jgi:hypothetical protein